MPVTLSTPVNDAMLAHLDDFGLDVYAFRAFFEVATQARRIGVCVVSVGGMAQRAGVSTTRFRKALRELERYGLIRREPIVGDTATYTINPVKRWRPIEAAQ